MKNQLLILPILLFSFNTLHAQRTENNLDAQQTLSKTDKHFFIENKGQWPSEVLYLAQLGGLNTWITKNGMLYEFYKTEEINPSEIDEKTSSLVDKFEQKDYKRWGQRVAYTLIGNNTEVNTQGKQKQSGYYNYLIGNDPSKHASYVGLYKEALVKQVYEGIDMRYYFDKGSLRYDYLVHPGADPSQIKFNLEGSDKNYLNEKGELVFTTCFGEVKNTELYCYQQKDKKQVSSKFIKNAEGYSFELGQYNKNEIFIIDPLIYSTYIGGSSNDAAIEIKVDNSNNAYITGGTGSSNYNITLGSFQITKNGASSSSDAFVTKLNSTGSTLIFSTFLGGNNGDGGSSLSIDNLDFLYITGITTSNDFPVTASAFQTTISTGGGLNDRDIFITKLNSTGSALIYSTYLGGSNDDYSVSIATNFEGETFITGMTNSNNFDVTPGAFQTSFSSPLTPIRDAFITKIDSTGSALIYSTYIGGSNVEETYSIALDSSNNAYITGITLSADFDITLGAFQATLNGNSDLFVCKLNSTGTALIYSTLIGGSGDERGQSIVLDKSNNAYITGFSSSNDYDITTGAYQTTFGGGMYDAVVSKINSLGSSLIYSTYFGGNLEEFGYSIKIDTSENAYITGQTNSNNFGVTIGAHQTNLTGGYDAFVSKLNNLGSTLIYSTYLGGSNNDNSLSITIDGTESVYIAGYTFSLNFITSLGAFQTNFGGGTGDAFITKLELTGATSILSNTKNNSFSISPNPSEGIYQLTFANRISFDEFLEVYDMQGRLVFNESIGAENTQQLNLTNQPNGLYILKVKMGDSQEVVKLVKM